MEKKKNYNALLIALGALLILGVGVSFGYYIARTIINGEGSNITAATENINGSEINVLGTIDFNDTRILPGHKNISSIKVTATGANEILVYNLKWEGENTLNTPLKYRVYRTSENISTGTSCEQKRELVGGTNHYSEECTITNLEQLEGVISSGTINKGETKVILATAETITSSESGTTVYYYIELEYPNLNQNQNSDIGGLINGKITVEENLINYLVASKIGDEATNDVLGKSIARSSFESITTVASKNVPSNVIESWDASQKHNGSIMAWYTDTNNNGLYELYIGQDGGVIANPNSSWLFGRYSNLTNIDLSHFDTTNVTTMWGMFHNNTSLTSLDLSGFNTFNVIYMSNMFENMTSLTNLNLSNFNTSKVINMGVMFSSATALMSLNISSFDTTNVTNMEWMFSGLVSLTNLNVSSFDTSKVTNMMGMFNNVRLTDLDLSNFNTSNVKNMHSMFSNATSLTNLNISSFDTSNVTNMESMFQNMTSLTSLDLSNFNTLNVTTMESMFHSMTNLTNLDLSSFNTSNVTNMLNMFYGMTSLTELNISSFDTSKVTVMATMFAYVTSLANLDLSSFNTSSVLTMESMFTGMASLTNLNLSNFNTSNVTTMHGMFGNTGSLQTLNLNNATFDSVTTYTNMFLSSNVSTITVKDANAQNFINTRLGEVGKTATVTIA